MNIRIEITAVLPLSIIDPVYYISQCMNSYENNLIEVMLSHVLTSSQMFYILKRC